jgi:uncharacterized membrane protein YbaN (DUF454 family)
MAAGFGCLVLGVLGLLLPVLQASVRFYNWLLNHRLFGPSVREWRNHRRLPAGWLQVAIPSRDRF